MTKRDIDIIIGRALFHSFIVPLMVVVALFIAVHYMQKWIPRVEASNEVMTVEKAEATCKKEGYKNWIRTDLRWGKVKVQCFDKKWKLKEIVIK